MIVSNANLSLKEANMSQRSMTERLKATTNKKL